MEINIDYILMLVKKYHDSHDQDQEILITIQKAVDASPELRSKKQLIQHFIARESGSEDVIAAWKSFVAEQREQDLAALIAGENLKPEETRLFLEKAFRDGEVKTLGTDLDRLMPPVSRFSAASNRAAKKQSIIDKLKSFFEKYFGT